MKLSNITDRIPRFLKNKYLIAIVAFVVWMFFLDRNNLISQYDLQKELQGLKKESQYYKEQTKVDSVELFRLTNDSLALEQIGRERYMMKRDSEDIYLIVRKPK